MPLGVGSSRISLIISQRDADDLTAAFVLVKRSSDAFDAPGTIDAHRCCSWEEWEELKLKDLYCTT